MVDSKRDLKFCVSTKGDGFPLFNVFKGNFKGDFRDGDRIFYIRRKCVRDEKLGRWREKNGIKP